MSHYSETQPARLLEGLTEPQRAAATHTDGPLLVIAGPGSGKTRTITHRIAHLILEVGIPPWNVLALTFTNKAASEMRERAGRLLSEKQSRAATCSTFHALCARLMRQFGEKLGLDPRYSIYDTSDQQRAVKQALEQLDMKSSNFPPARILGSISNAKNELIGPEEFAEFARDFYSKSVAKVYRKYTDILKQNNALDFDDLLLKTVDLLRNFQEVREFLQDRYQYILIDEYQDTNHAQFVIANTLAGERKNICATGDPDQSIYRWRGADIRNILEFEEHYPNATIVRLEQNYRSTKQILATADALIQNNRHRKHKALWTENDEGDAVIVSKCENERHEAKWVADQFRQYHDDDGMPWGAMAVFYRVNSLSRVIEDELRNSGIPYQIARGTAFYERKEIKDAVAYLRSISNPSDEVNLLRIINTPARGISNNTVKALQAQAIASGVNVPAVMGNAAEIPALNTRAVTSVNRFHEQLEAWRGDIASVELSLRRFVEQMLRESGLQDHYAKDGGDPDDDRVMNLGELVSGAQQFEDELALGDEDLIEAALARRLEAFLERISLISDVDAVESGQGAVTLMTLHAAKGLEFPVVSIMGIEEGLLPHKNAGEERLEIEEERRLCFVGITRAMERLMLSHTLMRSIFGQTMPAAPSRFLKELPDDAVERMTPQGPLGALDAWGRSSYGSQEESQYPPGALVKHRQFGIGRVLNVTAAGPSARIRVEFERVGVKTLVLEYARLEMVDDGNDLDDFGDEDAPF